MGLPHHLKTTKKYEGLWRRAEIPPKTVLLREGEISMRSFYVEKGCLRVCFNNQGKDLTCQFMFEGQLVSSANSFKKNIPSTFSIEAVETSVIQILQKKDYELMMRELSSDNDFLKEMVEMIFERQVHYMQEFLSFIRDTRNNDILI